MSRVLDQKHEAKFKRQGQRLQLLLLLLEEWMILENAAGLRIKEVRIRGPRTPGAQVLVVVKADVEGAPQIAFHSADTPESALRGALERLHNADIKWREDKPFEG